MSRTDWSEADRKFAADTFARMTKGGQSRKAIFAAIAHGVGREPGTVKQYFHNHRRSFAGERGRLERGAPGIRNGKTYERRPTTGAVRIAPDLEADRAARAAAANRRTYTQEFFGDPAPGYSALERGRR